MSHPRDPRIRRHRDAGGPFAPTVDPLAAAVRLEVAADAMRARHREAGPVPGIIVRDEDTGEVARWADGTRTVLEPPLTAQQFAESIERAAELVMAAPYELDDPTGALAAEADRIAAEAVTVREPAPVVPVAVTPSEPEPAPPVVVPPVFRNERRSLDWRSRHDPRSRGFGVRERLVGAVAWQDVMLPTGPVLDQGAEGACFGYAAAAAINAMRSAGLLEGSGLLDDAAARGLYGLAQRRDERPGEDYDGTSVTGGMRAVVEEGLAGGYLWSFGTRDIAQTLLHRRGAVIVGVPWLSGMYETGPGGLVELRGDDQGLGHCLAVVGLQVKGPQGQPGPYFVWQCSYGTGYGDGGFGYIHHRDLASLLHAAGEAAIPTRDPQRPVS